MALPIRIPPFVRPSPSDILQRICLAKFERAPPLFVESAVFIFAVRGRQPLPPSNSDDLQPGLNGLCQVALLARVIAIIAPKGLHPSFARILQPTLAQIAVLEKLCCHSSQDKQTSLERPTSSSPYRASGLAPVMQTLQFTH